MSNTLMAFLCMQADLLQGIFMTRRVREEDRR